MKRTSCIFLLFFCFLGVVSARNMQKIYPVESEVYHKIARLYVMQGLALPSATGPWSGGELKLMLSRLDCESLSPLEREWYDSVFRALATDAGKKNIRVGLDATLEGYMHTNQSSYFQGSDHWKRGESEQKPLVVIPLEGFIASSFYGYVEGDVAHAREWDEGENQAEPTMGDGWVSTNLPLSGLDLFVPYRALLAAGGEHWSLEIGRDKLSWGSGTTGNLLLGSQIQYHNMARIATYNDTLKYTFLVSSFPHPQNYYKEGEGYLAQGISSDYEDGIKAFIAHRLETRFWKDRIAVAVTDSVMYMSDRNRIDLIDFNPAMIYHNNFKRGHTNTIIGIDFDITPIRGLNLYTQVVIDDLASSGETKPGDATENDKAEPNGVGVIVGTTYVKPLKKGVLTCNFEGAYTSPYLYLRDGDVQSKSEGYTGSTRSQSLGEYGINFVVGTHSSYYKEQFMGYQYGCDAMVANCRVSYERLGSFTLTGNLFYMAHGTHDQFTIWSQIDNATVHSGWLPSSSHETDNQYDRNAKAKRNALCHTFVAGINGSCSLMRGISAFGQMDWLLVKNPGNISKSGIRQDLQITLGFEWKVDDFFTFLKGR